MEKCLGCLGIAFGSRRRKNRLKYRVNYDKSNGQYLGVEFDNLVLEDEEQKMNYGTTCHFVSQEEKEYLAKREYEKILEEQKKIDEQIDRKTFEDEERVRIEEESFREAQIEAARAIAAARKAQESSQATLDPRNHADHSLYSIGDSDETDEDFDSFLESVRVRSEEFRSNKAEYCNSVETGSENNNKVVSSQPKRSTFRDALSPDFSQRPRELDGIADGMSSDGSFTYDLQTQDVALDNPELEWDKFVGGLEDQDESEATAPAEVEAT